MRITPNESFTFVRVARHGARALAFAALVGGCAAVDDASTATDPSDSAGATAADEAIGSSSEELTGTTCLASVEDDLRLCMASYFCSPFYPQCEPMAYNQCWPSYNAARTACGFGLNRIHRVREGLYHNETKVKRPSGVVEMTFDLWPKPYGAGADPNPIYRCAFDPPSSFVKGGFRDFPSKDPNCEGKGAAARVSILGYSVPPTFSGVKKAKALYRCRTGTDHFLSTASNCEGSTNEGIIGYGLF